MTARPRPRAAHCVALLLALVACTGPAPVTSPAASVRLAPSPAASVTPSPVASRPGSTIPPLDSGPDALALEPFAAGLVEPIGITHAGDGSGDLYVNERGGRVRVVHADGTVRPEPFVDLSGLVMAGGERGLLGVAFHPEYADNRRLFVYYTAAGDGANTLAELTAAADGAIADPASLRILFAIPDERGNHNGGQLAFGPDGYLYVGLGDGGGAGDPEQNGQDRTTLLGKILRLDVDAAPDGAPYAVPPTNPYAAEGIEPGAGAPEVWAIGLRNPWRFSFDPRWGDLYIADVGQGTWEEIDRQPGDSNGGENYGWNVMEGRSCFIDATCDQRPFVKPIAQYRTGEAGTCAVVGGHVYRGTAQPDLEGVYVFGDYCAGLLYTLQVDEGTTTPKVVAETDLAISAFGTDEAGELYVADLAGGTVARIIVAP
ncbi:MAG TPA: PQQ-dependent sugar dehydrogenase [Candidatus Limnocylindria bacterium]|nr:PQQ-dependent sugar dehydrogenase [Candidatus Limnocylindria bacterium]